MAMQNSKKQSKSLENTVELPPGKGVERSSLRSVEPVSSRPRNREKTTLAVHPNRVDACRFGEADFVFVDPFGWNVHGTRMGVGPLVCCWSFGLVFSVFFFSFLKVLHRYMEEDCMHHRASIIRIRVNRTIHHAAPLYDYPSSSFFQFPHTSSFLVR